MVCSLYLFCFFFNDTATTEIYTLSLHDALPIYARVLGDDRLVLRAQFAPHLGMGLRRLPPGAAIVLAAVVRPPVDRKSTRLNSSHSQISYAVFCLKKKNKDTSPDNDDIAPNTYR